MDRWEYLISYEYKSRHHIAEYYLNNLDFVIDVGVYKMTIGGAYPYNVIPIDPLKTMFDSYHGTVAEWLHEHGDLLQNNTNFGVLALGLEIEGGDKEFAAFKTLVDKSKILILEHSIEHEPSVNQVNEILSYTNKDIVVSMQLEFNKLETPGFPQHLKRRMIVLQTK